MPRYDYRCERGHVTEMVQGVEIRSIPCPCGLSTERVPVYAEQFISGETVARGRTARAHEALDDKGRFDLRRVVEAQHELVDRGAMPDIKPLLRNARRKAAAGMPSAVARTE